jgi:hypothetical protein
MKNLINSTIQIIQIYMNHSIIKNKNNGDFTVINDSILEAANSLSIGTIKILLKKININIYANYNEYKIRGLFIQHINNGRISLSDFIH